MNNTEATHVALTRWVAGAGGRKVFEDAALAYDRVLGPLSQTAVIEASSIRFRGWPGDFTGGCGASGGRNWIMIMAGAASFTADDGEARIFLPGDILELADFGGDDLTMAACDQQPVRAAEIGSEPPSQNAAAAPPGTMSEPALPYLRNITGGDDRSHFEDGTMSYSIAGDGSLTTEAIAISGFQYVLASGDLNYDFHNAPQQQIVLPLIGGIRVRNGDGTERELRPGSVFFGEDTTGQGHVTRAVDGEIRFSLFAHLV